MSFDRELTPQWRPGYRFQYEPAQKGHVLLYPEGMIKLNESASAIGGGRVDATCCRPCSS